MQSRVHLQMWRNVRDDIVKRALSYPLKLIAKDTGVIGSVVSEKVLSNDNTRFGYNTAAGKFRDHKEKKVKCLNSTLTSQINLTSA